ncbi:MAG: CCA tRNA nucleotidyltransferase [bacterium]
MFWQRKINKNAREIIKVLKRNGHQAYLVGGCMRDWFLKIPVAEWDITTSAKPDEVSRLFEKVIPTGIDYGTVTILLNNEQFEVTTFRSDEKYVDGRHPSNVRFTDDIHRDLSRRDFTINALAYDPETKELIDDFEGQRDLKNKVIRAIGNAEDRFSEDGLRSIRACRFAAKLGFKIEANTFAAIGKTLTVTEKVAPERIKDEIGKLMGTDKPADGFALMQKSGLLKLIIPELEACSGVEQPPQFHKYDVFWHNLHACDAAPKNRVLRLAALLHDIGKPACQEGFTFYNHDNVGAETAGRILKRLKFSNNDIQKVTNLIRHHMFNYTTEWTDAAVRRFILRVGGVENIADLFALRLADLKAMDREVEADHLKELQKRIDKIIEEQNALHVADLKINGQDVMAVLKIPAGPKVGEVLNCLLEKVLDDPKLNERETLLEQIKKYA